LMLSIIALQGPSVSGTLAQANRFHDDKGSYTGTHVYGGPTKIDTDKWSDISGVLDRSKDFDIRGVKNVRAEGTHAQRGAVKQRELRPGEVGVLAGNFQGNLSINSPSSASTASPRAMTFNTPPPPQMNPNSPFNLGIAGNAPPNTPNSPMNNGNNLQPPAPPSAASSSSMPFSQMMGGSTADSALHDSQYFTGTDLENNLGLVFQSFCSYGADGNLDSAGFLKLCKDMKLYGKSLTSTDIDLIFQKSKSGGNYAKRLTFAEFRQVSVPLIASKKSATEQQVLERCFKVFTANGGQKILTGTRGEYNRFHDDKSTYTGVYKAGGPTKIDNVIDQAMLANRDVQYDIRGAPILPKHREYTHQGPGTDVASSSSRGPNGEQQQQQQQYQEQYYAESGGGNDNSGLSAAQAEFAAAQANLAAAQAKMMDERAQASPANNRRAPPSPQAQAPPRGGFSLNRSGSDLQGGIQQNLNYAPPSPNRRAPPVQRRESMTMHGATVAGEANRPGGIYDRLSNVKSFTGVYAKRFEASSNGGRINGDTINARSKGYVGNTNTGTDAKIDDISQILRR
jgi:hypothetical protein